MAPILASRGGASARAFGFGSLVAPLGDYQAIMTATVDSGGASSITFSSIPSTFKHLQIRGIVQFASAATLEVRMNSVSTANEYPSHQLYGDGATAGANSQVSSGQTAMPLAGGSSTANIFTGFVIDILDYANTNKYKTVRTLFGTDFNGSGNVAMRSGLWMNTAAITQLDLGRLSAAVNMNQYTQIALFGLKG